MVEELCKQETCKMKKILLAIPFVLIVIPFVFAYNYLTINIGENGEATFLGETNNQSIILPQGVSLSNNNIIGKTQELTKKDGEVWTFSYGLKDSELDIALPKGAVIKNISNGEIYLEGDQINVYAKEGVEISYSIEDVGGNYLMWGFVIGGLVLIITGITYFIKKNNSKKGKDQKNEKLEIIKQTLSEREKKIIDKLKEVGEIKHSRLQKVVEIPKASFSRHVQELEKKGLIKRVGENKNKKISLK